MKLRFAYALLALLVLGAASVAWAAQPSTDQATGQAEVNAPAADAPTVTAPATTPGEGGEIIPAELPGLFQQPVETDACCWADCRTYRNECLALCPALGEPDPTGCRDQCYSEFDTCTQSC